MKRIGGPSSPGLLFTIAQCVLMAASGAPGRAEPITLRLQTRDENNQPRVAEQRVDAARIGVVVMDMWDKHWDPLATKRVAALVPRMNQFLHNARAAGAQVIFSPSNTIHATYAVTKQRLAAAKTRTAPLPKPRDFQPAKPIPWTTCPRNMDGTSPYHSPPRAAWANQCHGLDIEPGDFITADDGGIDARQELWNIVQARKLTHLLYLGVHTNWCVSNRPNGLIPMKRLGLATALVRDLTDAWSDPYDGYERDRPRPEITPDMATELVVEHQERYIQPTVTSDVFPLAVPVQAVPLKAAVAAYSQPNYPVAAAIDGSTTPLNGWGNGDNPKRHNVAVFETADRVGKPDGVMLSFVLDFTSNPNHGCGRFRLAATTDPMDTAAAKPPGRSPFEAAWTVLRPEGVRSLSDGTRFRLLDDGSLLATASRRPACDRYVIHMRTKLAGITAFRLEAMTDPSLPKGGPGLRETNGNFVLGEFSVRVRPALTAAGQPTVVCPPEEDSSAGWQGDAESLRLAITDLIETFGDRYPHGREYLARLDAMKGSGVVFGQRTNRAGESSAENDSRPRPDSLSALAREALLENPLLDFDRLLLVKRRPFKNGQPGNADVSSGWDMGLPRSSAGNSALPKNAFDNEIAVLQPVRPDGRLTTLYRPAKHEFVGDVDLHFDGDRLLFASTDTRGRWHIYELRTDGTGLRQISRGDQPDVDSYDPCYLPDGGIAFCSSACFQGVPCNFSDVAVLYRMAADGGRVRQLGFEQDHDFNPVVMDDGRLLYLRWEYSDLPHSNSRRLFTMNPDGTGQMVFYGSNSYWPNGTFGARPIPGQTGKVIGIVAGHHGSYREGELVLFDVGRGRHEADGAVQRIPGRGQTITPLVRDELTARSWPKFAHPYPLSDKYFLVTCKRDERSPWDLYLVDVFDNLLPLYHLDGYGLFEPIPVRSTPRPPILASRVDTSRTDAVVHLTDVYQGPGLAGVPRGAVRRLRLFTYHFAYQGTGGLLGTVGLDGPWDIKRVLGTVPVEPDGSAIFRIPANTPISVQPLDEHGKALQLMRSWLVGMPGETVSCVGCHEHPSNTPLKGSGVVLGQGTNHVVDSLAENDSRPPLSTLAARKPPAEITPWYGPPRNFSFAREVQPVLDRYCLACHDGTSRLGLRPDPVGTESQPTADRLGTESQATRKTLGTESQATRKMLRTESQATDLRGDVLTRDYKSFIPGNGNGVGGRFFSVGYFELSRYVRRPGIESDMHLLRPAEYHADTTALVRMLMKGHYNVRLDADSWDRLITWIDLNAPYHGTWTEVGWPPGKQRERRRALRKLYAGVDEDPEALAAVPVPTRGEPLVPEEPYVQRPRPTEPAPARVQRLRATVVERRRIDLGGGVTMDFVPIPAGEFLMGDPQGDPDEQPVTRVSIDRPFWMGVCEVTNRQYACFDPSHDSRFESKNGYQFGVTGFDLSRPEQPVVRISWLRALAFCEWLTARANVGWAKVANEPAESSPGTAAAGERTPPTQLAPQRPRPTALRFTLPTEAQWEYACRAGTDTPFSFGDLAADFSPFANLADVKLQQFASDPYTIEKPLPQYTKYDDWIPRDRRFNDSGLVTVDVGRYRANAWGLHDMHGNAAEWTLSAYASYPYVATDGRDAPVPAGLKVIRGGSWRDRPQHSRAAYRWRYPAWQGVYNVGFRVVALDDARETKSPEAKP